MEDRGEEGRGDGITHHTAVAAAPQSCTMTWYYKIFEFKIWCSTHSRILEFNISVQIDHTLLVTFLITDTWKLGFLTGLVLQRAELAICFAIVLLPEGVA